MTINESQNYFSKLPPDDINNCIGGRWAVSDSGLNEITLHIDGLLCPSAGIMLSKNDAKQLADSLIFYANKKPVNLFYFRFNHEVLLDYAIGIMNNYLTEFGYEVHNDSIYKNVRISQEAARKILKIIPKEYLKSGLIKICKTLQEGNYDN